MTLYIYNVTWYFEASNEVQLQFCSKVICWQFKDVLLIAVEMKSVMNKVSAGYVLAILWALYVLTVTVLHVHNDLIIIQKIIIMHTHIHIHTQNSEVLFTKSTEASRQQTVGSSGADAASRSCGGSSWVARAQQQQQQQLNSQQCWQQQHKQQKLVLQ